jgi:hypothetical protein
MIVLGIGLVCPSSLEMVATVRFLLHGGASFGALGPVQLIPKEYKKQEKMELFFNNSA